MKEDAFIYGEQYILSAVMHADARNRAMSDARSRTCTTITFMWSTFPSWKSKSCGRNAARINRWWVRSRKLIAKLKAEIDSLKQEISDYKSVHSKLRAAELERENTELRGKVRSYEDVIQRNKRVLGLR